LAPIHPPLVAFSGPSISKQEPDSSCDLEIESVWSSKGRRERLYIGENIKLAEEFGRAMPTPTRPSPETPCPVAQGCREGTTVVSRHRRLLPPQG
jgi:hypothetical protein